MKLFFLDHTISNNRTLDPQFSLHHKIKRHSIHHEIKNCHCYIINILVISVVSEIKIYDQEHIDNDRNLSKRYFGKQ